MPCRFEHAKHRKVHPTDRISRAHNLSDHGDADDNTTQGVEILIDYPQDLITSQWHGTSLVMIESTITPRHRGDTALNNEASLRYDYFNNIQSRGYYYAGCGDATGNLIASQWYTSFCPTRMPMVTARKERRFCPKPFDVSMVLAFTRSTYRHPTMALPRGFDGTSSRIERDTKVTAHDFGIRC